MATATAAAATAAPATPSANVYQRLLAVQKAVGSYLRKDQTGHQFQYVGSSQVLGVIREAMDDYGLILEVSVTGHNLVTKWSVPDSKEHLTELDIEFAWVNVDDPQDRVIWHGYGQGLDTGEKGVGKALTYAEKYGLLKFFHIATDKADPDAFQNRVDAAKPREPQEPVIGEPGLKALAAEVATLATQASSDEANSKLLRSGLWEDVRAWTRERGVAQVADLTEAKADEIRQLLRAKVAAMTPQATEPEPEQPADDDEMPPPMPWPDDIPRPEEAE